jgi:site-specific recombinase XerD
MTDFSEHRQTRAIPELLRAEWPMEDQTAFATAARKPAGPFAKKRASQCGETTAPGLWKPGTWRNVAKSYGKWLAFIAATEPQCLIEAPATRVTEGRCQAYVHELADSGLAISSQGFHIYNLAMAMRVIAPGHDWTWLSEAGLALRKMAVPAQDKRSRIVPIADLYQLGIEMMEAASVNPSDRAALFRYRDGLILALWAARPWRVENVAALDIDRHLLLTETAGYVSFERHEMKTAVACDWTMPGSLLPYLRHYLDRVRPHLPGGRQHGGLWPSGKGVPLTPDGLAGVLERHTQARFSVRVHPHAVRYSAATSAAVSGPASAKLVMAVLGHSDPRISLEYYMLAHTLDASRKVNAALQDLRGRLAQ